MNRYLIIIPMLFVFISACNQNSDRLWFNTLKNDQFEDYFRFGLEFSEFENLDDLYDSMSNKIINEDIHLFQLYHNSVDLFNEVDSFNLAAFGAYDDIGDIYKRNVFEIFISRNDSIYFEDSTTTLLNLDEKLDEFRYNPNNLDHLSESRIINSKLLGEISISKGGIVIFGEIFRDSVGNATSWEAYYMVLDSILQYYSDSKKELSYKYFNKPYNNLDNEEKQVLSDIGTLYMWIFFRIPHYYSNNS